MDTYKKKYDKALEKAREYRFNGVKQCIADTLESIFPELKDSENKRIKEDIISYIKVANQIIPQLQIDKWITWIEKQDKVPVAINIDKMVRDYASNKEYGNEEFGRPINCMIRAYRQGLIDAVSALNLEKQDEQKRLFEFKAEDWYVSKVDGKIHNIKYNPVDKVEPKFKVGDWVVYYRNDSSREVLQVYDIRDGRYYFTDNVHFSWSVKECDEKSHLWTIQDAKDGDVLCYETKDDFIIFIYKNGHIHYHCCYSNGHLTTIDSFFVAEKYLLCYIHPATQEQRGTLFAKMKDAGYEWDAEKKELKKSNSYCQEHCKGFQETGKCFADGDCKAKIEAEQKPVWSEEDIHNIENIDSILFYDKNLSEDTCMKLRNWLKSLKEKLLKLTK